MPEALVAEQTQTETQPAERSFQDRVDALIGPAADKWNATGDIDAAEALQPKAEPSSDAKPAPSPGTQQPESPESQDEDADQTEAASGPAAQGQEQKSQGRGNRDWAATRRELAAARERAIKAEAQLELLKSERAGTGTSAPGARQEQQADSLEFPTIGEDETLPQFTARLQKYTADVVRAQVQEAMQNLERTQQIRSTTESWTQQRTAAEKKYKDFADVVDGDLQVSLAVGTQIFERPDGAELAYHLGKNPEVQQALLRRTDITGNYKTIADLKKAAKADPDLALELGRKMALAEVELDRIAASLKTPSVPAKKKLADQPLPSAEVSVDANAAAIDDPFAEAIRTGNQELFNQIANERARKGLSR